ncbi:MAG TPA: alanine racemase [Clostridiales bacterium]|nr:alanine racemase [Clostridiales bacterium]
MKSFDISSGRIKSSINLDNLEFNFKNIRCALPKSIKIMCVVKANAYGLGATKISKLYEELGADAFAVATLNEAIELRKSGILKDILILGYTAPEKALELSKFNISQTVFSSNYASKLAVSAKSVGVVLNIHLKIDTGMSRLGFLFQDKNRDVKTFDEIKNLKKIKEFNVEGIFTHFLGSDESSERCKKITIKQIENFKCISSFAKENFDNLKYVHCSNSGAILNYPQALGNCNTVRAGIILYGYYPSNFVKNRILLKNVLEVKTKIVQIKELPAGSSVSYGGTFVTKKTTNIAIVPIGYADGLNRSLSNVGKMIVNGKFAKIVGNICMDQCMLDVTDIPDVKEGDEVTVIGKSGFLEISADDIAKDQGTINYEVLCNFNNIR